MSYGASKPKKKRRGGGCCGCLVVLLALLMGIYFAARKWAPNHLDQALAWGRTQIVTKYPVLDRWVPRYGPTPAPTPRAPASTPGPITGSPTPEPIPTPAASAAPVSRAFNILSSPPPFTELTVGSGAEAKLGQTVVVRYGAGRRADAPETLMLGAGDTTPELEAGIRGMKVGGRRKIGETEVELLKVL